tara:strand:+ start:155 stop:685 length:531 start_codon:yes stop_codon:yes gene_type:complete
MSILYVDEVKSKTTNGAVKLTDTPIFHVTKSADQTLTDATHTLITFDEITDGSNSGRTINRGGLFGSNKLTVTAATAGYYFLYTNIYWQSSDTTTGETYGYWRKNGSTKCDILYSNAQGLSDTVGVIKSAQVVDLTTGGDYVEFYVYMDVANNGTCNINQWDLNNSRTTVGGWLIG